jgi:signal transduction histidine kinase/ligand-binding sensor domain-containing protein
MKRPRPASFCPARFFPVLSPAEAFYPNRQIALALWICLLIVFRCSPAFALDRDRSIVQFHHTTWTENDGAPGEISALAQTEDGYLWIGSERGLFSFDGVKFEEYKPQPGVELPSHSIYSLMAIPDGGLWIAFRPSGLGLLRSGSLTLFTRPEELPDSPIHSFACDHEGRIWAGTETGLVQREGTRWIPIGHDWNFAPDVIRDLFVDRDGTLWVATVKIVAFLRRGSKTFELAGAVGRGVTTLSQAKDGRMWFADNGIGEGRPSPRGVSSQLVQPVPIAGRNSDAEDPAVVADGLHELLFDREGALWITRLDSGIVRIRNPERLGNRTLGPHDRELESFGEKDGFSGGFAYKLLEDREGNIWVGCSKGLIRFRRNQVVPVSLPQRYQRQTLLAGEEGDVWIGTLNNKPLLHIRGESLLVEKVGERVSSVFHGSNGDVWWGSDTGIWRQRGSNFKYFPLPKPTDPPNIIYEIIPSRDDGGLWVKVGDFGTIHFRQGVWNLSDRPKGVPIVGPSASYPDPSGRVWLGFTAGQVYVLDGEKVSAYSQKDGLDVGRIKVIRGLGQHIWVGGELGLMFLIEGRFRRVTVAEGEPFGAVSGIIETVDEGLWLNEMKGIVQIPPEEIRRFMADPNHRVTYRRFDYLDGLPGAPQMSYTNSTAVETSDGRLWFATDNGLAWIDPAHFASNGVPPPVSILSIGNEKGRQPMSSAVEFVAGTHAVEIDYTALSLSIPERVEFRYKLEEVDKDWQDVGTRRQAFYTSLGPGHYRFHVIACNNDGVWNEQGAILAFSIAPAWYQTNWYLILCIITGVVAVWYLYQLRIRQIARAIGTRFDERLAERTRMARELHDTFIQTVQGTKLIADHARRKSSDTVQMHRDLDELSAWLDRAIEEGRVALNSLRTSTTEKNDLAYALQRATMNSFVPGAMAVKFPVNVDSREMHPVVRDEVYRIGYEAIRNACQHSAATQLEIELTYGEDLVLRVADNGVGIDSAVEDRGKKGHFGLQGMRERAVRIGGKLTIVSSSVSGTEIKLVVPGEIIFQKPGLARQTLLAKIGAIIKRIDKTSNLD